MPCVPAKKLKLRNESSVEMQEWRRFKSRVHIHHDIFTALLNANAV